MKILWRIGAVTPDYTADDMSGTGAMRTGGRWNSVGVPVVYAAESIALAVLETLAHLRVDGLPLNRYLVRIDVPDKVWEARSILNPVPVGWDAEPKGIPSIHSGDKWIASNVSALMAVPSVIVPEEQNVLINPKHGDSMLVKATMVRKWNYDSRLF